MPRKKFKCSRCDRSFSMAAHLARHMNTLHAPKGAHRRPVGRPPGRVAASTGGAAHLVGGMQQYRDELMTNRDQIDRELSALGDAMAALGGGATAPARGGKGVKRARRGDGHREGSLKSFIVSALGRRGAPATPKEIAAKVMQSGYKSRAVDLTKAVSNALPELNEVKRTGFGRYSLK